MNLRIEVGLVSGAILVSGTDHYESINEAIIAYRSLIRDRTDSIVWHNPDGSAEVIAARHIAWVRIRPV